MTDEVEEAYRRGLMQGESRALHESVKKAHERLDVHDTRLTALERVMYAGLGVVFLINLLPEIAEIISK